MKKKVGESLLSGYTVNKNMKISIPVLAVYIFLSLSQVFGQSQKILPLSSEIYAEMDALYLIRGLGTPSSARPWTVSEARMILDRVDPDFLNQREQVLYDYLKAEINKPLRFNTDNAFSFDARLDLALEAYAHTNKDDFVLEGDWMYGYEERLPPAKLSLEMGLYSWFYVFTDLQYSRNRFNERDEFRTVRDINQGIGAETSIANSYMFPWWSWAYSRSFITNIPTGTGEFDFDWPKRANITAGGLHWNLSIARDRIQWGRGYSGNFVIDSHRDYDEYFRFSAFSEKFKYEWLNVFYPGSEGGAAIKFMMAHRLEYRILPSLVLAVSENVMCRPDDFNLRYINPAFIFHQWYDRDNFNSLAHLELDFVPARGYRLYTQAAFDQIRAPWENDSEPGAWGILAGIEHARPVHSGVLSLSLECAYTTPLLYRRDTVDFITIGVTEVNHVDQNLVFDYTGYPYGGDAIVFQLDANYHLTGTALFRARLFGMIHGKMNYFISHNKDGDNSEYANLASHTPGGGEDEHEYTFGASLGANYTIPQPVSWLKIRAFTELDFIYKKNKLMLSETGSGEDIVYHKKGGAADFQFVVGIAISL